MRKSISSPIPVMRYYEKSQIYSVYGMTEASTRISALPPDLFSSHYDSVGFPLRGVRIQCVDQNGKPVPPGEDGELLLKGANRMLGYYKKPELTEKVFDGEWLRSGDLATIDEKGMIYIKGRKDNMINRAGMNIYPQEIENAIKSSSEIKEALVSGIRNEDDTETIVLKVVAPRLTKNDIFEICKEKLPSFQMPDQIELVTEIQKNASGKIIRNQKGKGNSYVR